MHEKERDEKTIKWFANYNKRGRGHNELFL